MDSFSYFSLFSTRSRRNAPKARPGLEILEDRSLPSCSVISGFVYEDVNNNGLFDAGEHAIAGSTVELRNDQGVVVATDTTDANGFYEFTHDQTIDQTPLALSREVVFPPTQTNFSLQGLVDQFDPELGELQSIEITYEGAITSAIRAENTSPTSATTIAGKVGGAITLTAPNAQETLTLEEHTGSFGAGSHDGAVDFAGTSGHNFGTKTASGSKTVTLTGSAMDAYRGTGKVSVGAQVEASSNASGGGNIIVDLNSSAEAKVLIKYNYVPSPCLKDGGYTIVQTTQPAGYLDGKESSRGVALDTAAGVDAIPVALAGQDLTGNNFGEIKAASLSGHVFHDADDDGQRDAGEAGIAGVVVTLTADGVNQTATTTAEGLFAFGNLLPGTYTLTQTQPANWKDGKDSLGSLSGTLGNDVFSAIVVASGAAGVDYDFGEKEPDLADLSIVKAASSQSVLVGSLLNYTITVSNHGPAGASEVKVVDQLPPGVTFVEAHGEGWTVANDGNVLTATRAALARDQVGVIHVTVRAPGVEGDLVNTSIVSASTPDTNPANNQSTVTTPVINNPGNPFPLNVGPLAIGAVTSKFDLLVGPGAPSRNTSADFVNGAFQTLLGRAATAAELTGYDALLRSGRTPQDVAAAIYTSPEQLARQARLLYQSYLDRLPTAAEETALVQQLASGTSQAEAIVSLITSEEYVESHPGQHGLVAGFHTDILGRLPDTAGLVAAAQAMGNQPLEAVARGMLNSSEGVAKQIDIAYHTVLRRAANPTEVGYWTAQFQQAGVTYDQLVQTLLGGDDFAQLLKA